jgi:hypothetical protein
MITFQSTFEILNWASALDEYVAKNWTIDGEHVGWTWRGRVDDGDLVNAIRFARNRVHHQWATALVPEHDPPNLLSDWIWVQSKDLPQPTGAKHNNGLDDYDRRLANHAVRHTLRRLRHVFGGLTAML